MDILCAVFILLVALGCAMLFGNNKRSKVLEEKAIRFAEECYIKGVIPIGEVKRMAAFYLVEESKGKLNSKEAQKRIEETLKKYTQKE